jgi:hypothetical protein
MTNPSPNTGDLSGLPGPVVEQVKQITAEARQKQSDAQSGKGQASVIGLYAHLGIRTPSLEEFEEARREFGANFPRDFPDHSQ